MGTKWRYSVGFRLGVLLAVIVMITGIASVTDSLAIKTRNTALLGEIRLLMNENRGQVMLALQHSPASPFSKMHDHPVSAHLDRLVANHDRITVLWKEYMAQHLSEREQAAAERYAKARGRYVNEGLMAAKTALGAGEFEQANFVLIQKINPLYKEAEEDAGGELIRMYSSEADQPLAFWRALIVAVDFGGALIAIVFGVWVVCGITRRLSAVVRHADQSVSRDDFSNSAAVPGECEVGLAARAFNSLTEKSHQVTVGMRDSPLKVTRTAQDLVGTASQTAQTSSQQSESVAATAAAVEEISISLSHTTDNACESTALAESSRNALQEAHKVTQASMGYTLKIELHPLGVVVIDDQNKRELLIEGESCFGISFSDLKQAANREGWIKVGDSSDSVTVR